MKLVSIYIICLFLLGVSRVEGQNVAINEDGALPDNSAMLEVTASDKGLLIPRMTETEKNNIPSPATGLLLFQTDNSRGFYYNNGTSATPNWVRLTSILEDSIPTLSEVLNSGNDANAQSILNVGALGIGTAAPNYEFHINQPTGLGALAQMTESSFGTTANDGFVLGTFNGLALLANLENTPMEFHTNNIERMRISAAGLVGINNNAPDSLLDVNGSARLNSLNINSAYTFPTGDGNNNQTLVTDGGGNLSWINVGDTFGNHIATQNIRLNGNYLSNDGDNEGIFVDNDGDVGVGGITNTFAQFSVYDPTYPNLRITSGLTSSESNVQNSAVIEFSENNVANWETGGYGFQMRYIGNTNDRLQFRSAVNGVNDTNLTILRSSGNVGVGIDLPATTFHVRHANTTNDGFSLSNVADNDRWHFHVQATNSLQLYFNNALRGTFNSTSGAYTSVSDARLKKNIKNLHGVAEKVSLLSLKSYHFANQLEDEVKSYGFLAQELKEYFPSLVKENFTDAGEKIYTVDYAGLGAVAIGAIKEQQEIIEKLYRRLEELEQEVKKNKP
jgi:hypothetical protein